MKATEYVKKYGEEIINLAIARKEDCITKDEFKKSFACSIFFLGLNISKSDSIEDLVMSTSLLSVFIERCKIIVSTPKIKPGFKLGGVAIIGENEPIIMPNGQIFTCSKPDIAKLPNNNYIFKNERNKNNIQ